MRPTALTSFVLFSSCHLFLSSHLYIFHQHIQTQHISSYHFLTQLPILFFQTSYYFSPVLFSRQCTPYTKTPNTPHPKTKTLFLYFNTHRNINQVSNALRAEFARGDGRVKKKEDERRKNISPSETLFVVNFHEETTKREDLQMLFEPYGELVRIEMKRNYAFVQFSTVDEASRAKDATNGGKLDQSEITVEFVARRMGEGGGRDRGRK